MSIVQKSRGKCVIGDLEVLDDLIVDDDVTITGDIAITGDFAIGESGDGSDLTMWGDTALYKAWWDADGDTNGAFYFGADTKGVMTIWYGDTTAYLVKWDPSGDTNGAWYFGADTKGVQVNLYGDVTGCGVFWDPTTDTNGTLKIGGSGGSKGVDLIAYGATNGNYLHWDRSADDLLLVGTATQLSVAGDTDSSSVTTGSLRTAGGLGVVKTLYVGTGADIVGNLNVNGTTVVLDGSTSVRGISAGFTSQESPANRLGVNATIYMQVATTDTTGITAITHTGSAPAVTWTADSLSFVGDFDSNGATAALDGSTSVRLLSAGFVSTESPSIRFGYSDSIYTSFAVANTTGNLTITHVGGSTDLVTWTAAGGFNLVGAFETDAITGVGNLDINGTTAIIDGSTSVRNVSAGFNSLESPANRLGLNATEYMQVATTVTTGITAITHTGSAPAVTWTADSLSFVGDFDSNGATAVLDGSTSSRLLSAGFNSLESPANRLGLNATEYMQVATTVTTGITAITHTGSAPAVTWTADSLSFVGDFDSNGATAALDGSTSVRGLSAGFVSLEAPDIRFGYSDSIYTKFAVANTTGSLTITHVGGSTDAVSWTAAGGFSFVGAFSADSATTAIVDGATSFRGVSAGFTSLESPANRLGLNATEYIQFATTVTTGITAITHTGSAPAVTWTADSLSFVGDFDSNGATAALDGSTSVRLLSAGFVSTEAPDIRFGYSDSIYTKFAVANTTGNLTITHVGGSTDLVTWTAAGGFSFVGNTTVTGTFGASGTISVGLDATAGMLELYPTTTNKGTTTLTMTDNAGDTITNINIAEQAGARTYTVPDAGASAAFLMTDSFKTWWSISLGVVGEDTDGAGTNGGGLAGGVPDLTTHDYNDGAGGANDVHCVCKDATDGATYVDLKTASSLTAWTNNYQLQPDAASEAAGDAFAIGFDEQFCEIAFNDLSTGNGQLATYGGDCGKWQYSTGAGTWSDLTVFDNTDLTAQDGLRTLQRTGAVTWAPPSNWALATYDSEEAYWVQWVVTAEQLTQPAIIDDTNKDEPIVVIPNGDTFDAPFKATVAEIRVTDMGATLHDAAIKFVVGNFTDGVFTEEFTWTASQANDSFTPATPLAMDANDLIGVCITDDAGSTNNPAFIIELEATYLD